MTKPPLLKITGLHVEGLRALRRVDWPADGMGWGDAVPDVVVIGGVNGSGKTTLLELLFESAHMLQEHAETKPGFKAFVQIEIRGASLDKVYRVSFQSHNSWPAILVKREGKFVPHSAGTPMPVIMMAGDKFAATDLPSAIYLPSDRALVIPEEAYKAAGNLRTPLSFTHRFQIPAKWSDSLEAVLYAARWADLNALAAGRTEHNFDVYAEAFSTFFENKRLDWENGDLVVRLLRHPLK